MLAGLPQAAKAVHRSLGLILLHKLGLLHFEGAIHELVDQDDSEAGFFSPGRVQLDDALESREADDREGRFRGEEVACFAWIEFHKVVRIGTGQPQRSNVADARPCLWDVPLHQQAPKFPLMDDRLDFKDERLPEPFPD